MPIDTDANLGRMMRAENVLAGYVQDELKSGTREVCKDDACDLIADICHLLHGDEKTAGCLTPEEVKTALETAYNNFYCEAVEPDDIELAARGVI